jgi:hypothetical protein
MTGKDAELLRVRSSVIAAHRGRRADPADIQRAYLRFSWARRRAPRPLPVVRWLLAGVAFGLGVASAATFIQTRKTSHVAASASVDGVAKLAKAHRGGFSAPSPARQAAPSIVASAEPSGRALASPPPASSAWGAELPSPAALPSVTSTAEASEWQRAAAALRSGDLRTAEAALAALENSDSPHDRQAAQLARAQLLVKSGRASEAIPSLQRLAREGDTPIIRSQAASLLQNLQR